nr:immunoglobulin heavy chain junction region [Macaca mulatta]
CSRVRDYEDDSDYVGYSLHVW